MANNHARVLEAEKCVQLLKRPILADQYQLLIMVEASIWRLATLIVDVLYTVDSRVEKPDTTR